MHSLNIVDIHEETGKYFCIYSTFVTKRRALFALILLNKPSCLSVLHMT